MQLLAAAKFLSLRKKNDNNGLKLSEDTAKDAVQLINDDVDASVKAEAHIGATKSSGAVDGFGGQEGNREMSESQSNLDGVTRTQIRRVAWALDKCLNHSSSDETVGKTMDDSENTVMVLTAKLLEQQRRNEYLQTSINYIEWKYKKVTKLYNDSRECGSDETRMLKTSLENLKWGFKNRELELKIKLQDRSELLHQSNVVSGGVANQLKSTAVELSCRLDDVKKDVDRKESIDLLYRGMLQYLHSLKEDRHSRTGDDGDDQVNKIRALQEEVIDLKSQVTIATSALNTSSYECQLLQEQLTNLQHSFSLTETQLQNMIRHSQDKYNKVAEELAQTSSVSREKEYVMHADNELLRESIVAKDLEIKHAREESEEALRLHLEEVAEIKGLSEVELLKLASKLSSANERILKLEGELAFAKAEWRKSNSENDRLRGEVSTLKNQSGSKSRTKRGLLHADDHAKCDAEASGGVAPVTASESLDCLSGKQKHVITDDDTNTAIDKTQFNCNTLAASSLKHLTMRVIRTNTKDLKTQLQNLELENKKLTLQLMKYNTNGMTTDIAEASKPEQHVIQSADVSEEKLSLSNQLAQMESKVSSLMKEKETVDNEVVSLRSKVSSLSDVSEEKLSLTNQLAQMESKVSSLMKEKETVDNEVVSLRSKVSSLSDVSAQMESKVSSLMKEKETVDNEVVSLRSKVSSLSEDKVVTSNELARCNDGLQQLLQGKYKLEVEVASHKKKLDESVLHIKDAAKAIAEVNNKYLLSQQDNIKLVQRIQELESATATASLVVQSTPRRLPEHDASDDDSLGMGSEMLSASNSLDEVESQNMLKEVGELQLKLNVMKEREVQMRKELSQEHEQNKLLLDALNKSLSNEAADRSMTERVECLERENAQLKMQLNKMLI